MIGEKLRRQRTQLGLDIAQIAKETKIGTRLLQAIEAEDFDKLPGGVFRKSFVRQYASALGLQEEEIASDLKQFDVPEELPELPPEEAPKFAGEMPSILTATSSAVQNRLHTHFGAFAAFAAVMLGCAGIYAWWQSARPEPGMEPLENAERVSPPLPVADARVETARVSPSTPSREAETQPPLSAPAPTTLRVGLTAGEKTWVSVSSDGKQVFANELEANQSKTLEAAERIRVLVGNAGGLMITLNGKPIGTIGSRGQVRVVEITQAGFQIVSRKPTSDSPASDPL